MCGGAQDVQPVCLLPPAEWSSLHQPPKAGARKSEALWFSLLQEESKGCGKCMDTTPPSHQHFL